MGTPGWSWSCILCFHTFFSSPVLVWSSDVSHVATKVSMLLQNTSKPAKKHQRDNAHWRCQRPLDATAVWCPVPCPLWSSCRLVSCVRSESSHVPHCDLTPDCTSPSTVCRLYYLTLCFCPSLCRSCSLSSTGLEDNHSDRCCLGFNHPSHWHWPWTRVLELNLWASPLSSTGPMAAMMPFGTNKTSAKSDMPGHIDINPRVNAA